MYTTASTHTAKDLEVRPSPQVKGIGCAIISVCRRTCQGRRIV